jgi:hypothetical protein
MLNNTPPTPRGTFPTKTVYAPPAGGLRTSPDHRFAGAPTGSVQAQALRELILLVGKLESRVRALEADSEGNGARG